jgi:hypothetical protein
MCIDSETNDVIDYADDWHGRILLRRRRVRTFRALLLDDVERPRYGEGLKVESRGGVVVSGHGQVCSSSSRLEKPASRSEGGSGSSSSQASPLDALGPPPRRQTPAALESRSVTYAVVAATTGSHKRTLRQQVQKLATCQCQRKGGR